ncbi:threonine synthase [Flavobacterium selenitireducens]|uniref:threonine synthase n=1 Tax=Flavobacterium selenitireducens TaxID=2722704 RepID=UPI00168A44F6|nr:threonine synthase [Flavobacterium selenitireducens]MBD3580923.1 threonine synthase [Flavobacterium selenitireducens]
MEYYSLHRKSPSVTFRNAVIQGLAPDKGLYFPKSITPLGRHFFEDIEQLTDEEIAFQAIRQFVGDEIPEAELRNIVSETLSFPFPLVEVGKNVFSLELFHGPTLAFKDVGARFMARCVGYFNRADPHARNTVLVATSGDTGGAVASGFLNVPGVEIVILYPDGKVSDIQERQLTTYGRNISALRVDGVFDDCQAMVKAAFLDPDLAHLNLTSANSINVARWLPQMFYFFFAYKRLKSLGRPLVVSCPSGNFGNICAGVLAKKLGLPIAHFVASTNANDTVPRFLKSWEYDPKPSVETLSNAMDVGNPSNFIRIRELYGDDKSKFDTEFSSYPFSDEETSDAIQIIFERFGYVLEPHGAVAYLGLQKELARFPDAVGIFLETAHPVKFREIAEKILSFPIEVPAQIEELMRLKKVSSRIGDYGQLKSFLLKQK